MTGNTAFRGVTGIPSFLSPVVHSISTSIFKAGRAGIPLNSNLPRRTVASGLYLRHAKNANYAIDFVLSLMESRGVGKILSEPKGIHPEQREADGQARSADSDPDQHQQHDLDAMHRRRFEAGSDAANHGGRNGFPGRRCRGNDRLIRPSAWGASRD